MEPAAGIDERIEAILANPPAELTAQADAYAETLLAIGEAIPEGWIIARRGWRFCHPHPPRQLNPPDVPAAIIV